MIDLDLIKKLREETSVSISKCKEALEKANGDIKKAKEFLKGFEKEIADKKSSRETNIGIVESYIHQNKRVGVLLDIRCESDFVAKSEEFGKLAHEICLQIAALNPKFIKKEDIPEDIIESEKKAYNDQFSDAKKPEKVIEEIIKGKILKFKKENSLLEQLWVKDPEKTIKGLIEEKVAKFGENIAIKSFVRYEI